MPGGAGRERRQILFVVEGDRAEPGFISAAMQAFGVDTEQYAVLTYKAHVHSLLKTMRNGLHGKEIDFESIDIKEVLAEMIEGEQG